eukprot:gene26346-34980_t
MNIVNELPWLIRHFLQQLTPISLCLDLQTNGMALTTLVDSVALVEGSFLKGKGVGIANLTSLYRCDVLLHVIRVHDDDTVLTYEDAPVDPVRDLHIDLNRIEHELMDIDHRIYNKEVNEEILFQKKSLLRAYEFVSGEIRPKQSEQFVKSKSKFKKPKLPSICKGTLLSAKAVVYLLNASSRDYLRLLSTDNKDHDGDDDDGSGEEKKNHHPKDHNIAASRHRVSSNKKLEAVSLILPISCSFESHLVTLDKTGQLSDYYALNQTHKSCITALMRAVYRAVGVIQFYTVTLPDNNNLLSNEGSGCKSSVKCWNIQLGGTILEAAAIIDTNISRNFTRCDLVSFHDFQLCNGDKVKIILEGRLKSERRKYVVNDGDIALEFIYRRSSVVDRT